MLLTEVLREVERLAEVLAWAQDYDEPVLAELHGWFRQLVEASCPSRKLETAAVSVAAASLVEQMLCEMPHARCSREEMELLLVNEVNRSINNDMGRDPMLTSYKVLSSERDMLLTNNHPDQIGAERSAGL